MLGRRLGRRARGDRGAAAVEFAIVVPVLLTILLGIVEFASSCATTSASPSATRVGAAHRVARERGEGGDLPGPAARRA